MREAIGGPGGPGGLGDTSTRCYYLKQLDTTETELTIDFSFPFGFTVYSK